MESRIDSMKLKISHHHSLKCTYLVFTVVAWTTQVWTTRVPFYALCFFFPNKYSPRFLAAGFASGDSANPGWERVFSHSRSRIPNRGSKILFLIHGGLNLQMRTADCRVKSYKMIFVCNPRVVFKGQLCTGVTTFDNVVVLSDALCTANGIKSLMSRFAFFTVLNH